MFLILYSLEAMEHLKNEMKDVPVKNLHSFGVLKFNVDEVEMKLVVEDRYRIFQLMCFDQYIVASELYTQEHFEGLTLLGNSKSTYTQIKRFFKYFKMEEIHEIRKADTKTHKTIHLISYKEYHVDNQNSFILKFPAKKDKQAKILYDRLEEMRMKMEQHVEKGTSHDGHECKLYRKEVQENQAEEEHQKCADCDYYLFGKLQMGVKCYTCNGIYHEECFKSDKEEVNEENLDDPEDILILNIDSQSDFDMGTCSKDAAEDLLNDKVKGTFLLRYSKKKDSYVISRKLHLNEPGTRRETTSYAHHVIDEEVSHGIKYYWLEYGQGYKTILELVEHHRKTHCLYTPINSAPSEYETENTIIVQRPSFHDEQYQPLTRIEAQKQTPFTDYLHGDMVREEAGNFLENQPEGTFIIRRNDGGYRISRVPSSNGSRLRHFVIHTNRDGQYSLSKKKYFNTIEDMVENYQHVDKSNQYWLGEPKLNKTAQDRLKPDNLTDDEMMCRRHSSKRREPFSLSYYHGTMNKTEAQRMLIQEPSGTFLLRMNETKEFRLSHKKASRIEHIR